MLRSAKMPMLSSTLVVFAIAWFAASGLACSDDGDQGSGDAGPTTDGLIDPDAGDGGTENNDAGEDGGSTCGGALTRCADQCVDLNTHRDFCGDCDTACGAAQACVSGQCVTGVSGLVVSEVCALDPGFFELFNGTQSGVDLAGYQIQWETDGLSNGSLVLPSYALGPQEYVVIMEGSGDDGAGLIHLNEPLFWGQGVAVRLLDPGGQGVDFVRTGNATTAPPTGTTWVGPNADNPDANVDQSLARQRLGR